MADPEADARFQDFIAQPGSRGSQLRDAFAQLMAMGQTGAVPMEAVWAAQGLDQLKPPSPSDPDFRRAPVLNDNDNDILKLEIDRPQGYSGDDVRAPVRNFALDGGNLAFPTAPEKKQADRTPFHGKGEIIGPYAPPKPNTYDLPPGPTKNYDMPPGPKKKTKKKDKG